MKINLNKYNENCSNPIKYVYSKRYKKNGEEYLKVIDEINIEEDLQEKKLQIDRIIEIINIQKRAKEEELIENLTLEDITNMKELTKFSELDTYDYLNKMNELKEVYNQMPEDVRMKYNNLSRFGKEFLPNFIKEQTTKIKEQEELVKKRELESQKNSTFEELQDQILKLQEQLNINKGDVDNNVE